MNPHTNDIGSLVKVVRASVNDVFTAGSPASVAQITGHTIDRFDAAKFPAGPPDSAVLAVSVQAVLGATETASVALVVEDSANGTDFDPFASAAAQIVATGASGGSTEQGVASLKVNLRTARRYIRAKHTPSLSRANTDTGESAAVFVFGGQPTLPAA